MWYKHNFFKYALGLLLILVNIYFLGRIEFFLVPLKNIVAIIFFPILISGLLYYLLRPLLNLAVKIKIPRTLAILIIFFLLLVLIISISAGTGSMVVSQVNQLIGNLPSFFETATNKTIDFFNSGKLSFIPAEQVQQQLTVLLGKIVPFLSENILNNILSGLSAIANIATVLIIVPFILFYLLKDDKLFRKYMMGAIPEKHKETGDEILEDIDKTISTYIIGQAIIAFTIGVLMYIGYLILGVEYALILALFALITAFIPILGAFIGVIPAVLVGLTVNPIMALKIVILMIIVQQFEGNLISPQLMGKRMNIHPLTFIILLLAAASLYGFIGMLIAVPVYAVLKVLIKNIYKIYKLQKNQV
jgi:predicted PurR-regulated permease PerM